ncbi:phage virion morphogenesis protein [Neorhizobium sp. T786]|uniref:phage virion morphogenesis protein n=1 Tax=Pseudorhizobium xiangyangii TaxID=2883104 RepID=UPI001D000E1D|nr:phage virion morphogenesis protein [Neorhizobium xiangyangii]MCB5204251.1 phage virion morphogenesis protein [Neorhizobium xiangyangii]
MTVALVVDSGDFDLVLKKLSPLFNFQPSELMTTLGALGESQTRRRITDEKTSPDGTAWTPNHEGTPILVQTGQHLLYSIAWTASASEAEWGSTWEYAHVHQDGMTIIPKNGENLAFAIGGKAVFAKSVTIPARPFVGLSTDNIKEIIDVVTDHFGVLQ